MKTNKLTRRQLNLIILAAIFIAIALAAALLGSGRPGGGQFDEGWSAAEHSQGKFSQEWRQLEGREP